MAFANVPVGVYGNSETAADLTNKLYHAGVINAAGKITFLASAGGAADGVISLNAPLGRAGQLTFLGIEKIALGGTVTVGANLAADAAGKFVVATNGDVILGRCLLGGASGGVGTMMIYPKAQSVSA